MTFKIHTISNETFKKLLNNMIDDYFQVISIANQLLQKKLH